MASAEASYHRRKQQDRRYRQGRRRDKGKCKACGRAAPLDVLVAGDGLCAECRIEKEGSARSWQHD